MRRFLPLALLAIAACDSAPPGVNPPASEVRTISSVSPAPAALASPPILHDEAPPPKPKALPWETPTPIVFSPEDEKVRGSLPYTPAIAMDPVDGSKISIRAATPTFEYKGKIYYFSSEETKQMFVANPESALKGGMMRL
jgi:YHS domain-containing protein